MIIILLQEFCGECFNIEERYRITLEDKTAKLISFRGNGCVRHAYFLLENENPYSEDEMKNLIELIFLGITRVHFVLEGNRKIDISFLGIRVRAGTEQNEEKL